MSKAEISVYRDDLERLLSAARDAARKLKTEYDRGLEERSYPLDPIECWAECERLWEELESFQDIYAYLTGGSVLVGTGE